MHLATHVDLKNRSQDLTIWFNCKPNLTSAISNLANHDIVTSYVSRHNAMAYDNLPTQGTGRPHERHHIRAVYMHGQTQKGRTQPNAIHGRWWQNQLPRQSSHPNRGNAGGQIALPQCDLHKGCVIHDNGHLILYLMTPLHHAEFIWIKISDIPADEVLNKYNLREKATKNGSIYIRAKCGMYGLPQTGLFTNKLLKKPLNKHGYRQSKLVPGLWNHDTRPI